MTQDSQTVPATTSPTTPTAAASVTCDWPETDWTSANSEAAARGKAILQAYSALESQEPSNVLCNLIADLMHACDCTTEFGEFDEAIRLGDVHHEMDLAEGHRA